MGQHEGSLRRVMNGRVPEILHELSLNDPLLRPLPAADPALQGLGGDSGRDAAVSGVLISRGPAAHLLAIREAEPGPSPAAGEKKLVAGLRGIQQALGGRYTLLGLGLHPALPRPPAGAGGSRQGPGSGNGQCLRIRLAYRDDDEYRDLHHRILPLVPYLAAVSCASPFVGGRLEPAAGNRLLSFPAPVSPGSLICRLSPGWLEVRCLDEQECIHSGTAMASFFLALLRHPAPAAGGDERDLSALLDTALQHGTSRLQPELERLLRQAREKATGDEMRFLPVIARRIEHGSLAETLGERAINGETLPQLLQDLALCLKTNIPYGMVD